MESKYKIGQVVVIAEDIDQFNEGEHRHLTEVMTEAYNDLALIVDVKPAEGIISSTDDGFNYSLKILVDRSYAKKCEEEIWTSELFEKCATPIYKIGDLVRFWYSQQYDTDIIYKVESYFKDEDNSGNFVIGYKLVNINDLDNDYFIEFDEVKYLESVSIEQVNIANSSEEKFCSIKSDADIISGYNLHDIEFTKQQIINLQQKVKEYENRLRKQEEFIARSDRSGELGIFNRANQVEFGRSEVNYSEIALTSRKRVGFLEN